MNYRIQPLSFQEILTIYETVSPLHFPKEELRPLSNIKHLLDRDGYQGLGLYLPDAALAGYALFIAPPKENVVLLDFFAIREEYRCLGLGGIFLREMQKHFSTKQGLLLETEDVLTSSTEAEKSLRTRRNDFYLRNGAFSTGIHSSVAGVFYEIFFLPSRLPSRTATPDASLLRSEMEQIYRFMLSDLGPEAYEQLIRFH